MTPEFPRSRLASVFSRFPQSTVSCGLVRAVYPPGRIWCPPGLLSCLTVWRWVSREKLRRVRLSKPTLKAPCLAIVLAGSPEWVMVILCRNSCLAAHSINYGSQLLVKKIAPESRISVGFMASSRAVFRCAATVKRRRAEEQY